MSKRINIVGKKFGKLTVVSLQKNYKKRGTYYLCICDCGNKTIVGSRSLRKNRTTSCGCYGKTRAREFDDPKLCSAKLIWKHTYSDGCSFEKFLELTKENCFYCDCPPSNNYNKYLTKEGKEKYTGINKNWAKEAYFSYQGLDRWNSDKNHSENNLVPSCFQCNAAKHNHTPNEFFDWIEKIANHMIELKILKIDEENNKLNKIVDEKFLNKLIRKKQSEFLNKKKKTEK